jgi:hypothetical protein
MKEVMGRVEYRKVRCKAEECRNVWNHVRNIGFDLLCSYPPFS